MHFWRLWLLKLICVIVIDGAYTGCNLMSSRVFDWIKSGKCACFCGETDMYNRYSYEKWVFSNEVRVKYNFGSLN